jgi:hypothetical protein
MNKLSPPAETVRWRVLQALIGMAAHLLQPPNARSDVKFQTLATAVRPAMCT